MNKEEYVNSKLEPLKQWYCDSCEEVIESVDKGELEWCRNKESNGKDFDFRIVHQNEKCRYDSFAMAKRGEFTSDVHLTSVVGTTGMLKLLSKIEYSDVRNNAELIEIIRRLHIPYYEEARQFHEKAKEYGLLDGENETTRYTVSMSKEILNRYNS